MATPADELVALYLRSAARLRAQLRAALQRDAVGTAAFRAQQLAAVQAELRRLEAASSPLAQMAIRRAYLEGATTVDQALTVEPMPTTAQGRFYGVHEAAVARYHNELDRRLAATRRTVGRQIDDVFARVGRGETALGIAGADTRREVTARIVAELEREGLTGFVDRRGRRWALDTYGEMVARTTTREATTQGTANRMTELGHDLVQISWHAGPCDICKPYERKIYSLTGTSPDYPPAENLPPFHPRCRHVMTPAPIFDASGRRLPGRPALA